MSQIRFGHLELFVSDPSASKRFYCDLLGFDLVDIQHDQFVWLRSGRTEILLRPGANAGPAGSYQSAPFGLVFYTEALPATARRLEENGVLFRGTDGSDHCLVFTDPDGHWLQLVDPMM
jgi:catechol 2,3-dioxygenase-like lactoylglutathione lyase family enzyme